MSQPLLKTRVLPWDEMIRSPLIYKHGDIIPNDKIGQMLVRLALEGLGKTKSNPLVGCIILDSKNRIMGLGAHREYGKDHAEVDAFKDFQRFNPHRSDLDGCHVFVSLEPCAHQGKTPACADFLVSLKPQSLTYACEDPFELVKGKGVKKLNEAGIKTNFSKDLFQVLLPINARFLNQQQICKRPHIAIKYASSSNAMYARKNQKPYWFTGQRARDYAHALRINFDSIMIGINTLSIDKPTLNIRHTFLKGNNPDLIIIDPKLKSANLHFEEFPCFSETRNCTYILHSNSVHTDTKEKLFKKFEKTNPASELKLLAIESEESQFSGDMIVDILRPFKLNSILIEGGMHTAKHFWKEHLMDELFHYVSPEILDESDFEKWTLDPFYQKDHSMYHCSINLEGDLLFHSVKNRMPNKF